MTDTPHTEFVESEHSGFVQSRHYVRGQDTVTQPPAKPGIVYILVDVHNPTTPLSETIDTYTQFVPTMEYGVILGLIGYPIQNTPSQTPWYQDWNPQPSVTPPPEWVYWEVPLVPTESDVAEFFDALIHRASVLYHTFNAAVVSRAFSNWYWQPYYVYEPCAEALRTIVPTLAERVIALGTDTRIIDDVLPDFVDNWLNAVNIILNRV